MPIGTCIFYVFCIQYTVYSIQNAGFCINMVDFYKNF